MTYKLSSSKKAEKDIEKAIEWYADINKVLAIRFYNDLIKTKKQIQQNPKAFQIRYSEIRIAFLYKFPFGVHFRIIEDKVFHIVLILAKRLSRALL